VWAHPPVGLFTEGYVVCAVSEKLERDRERDRLAAWRRRMLNHDAFDLGLSRGQGTASTAHAPSTSSVTSPSVTRGRRKRAHTRRGGAKKRALTTTTIVKEPKKKPEEEQTVHLDENDMCSTLQRHSTPIPRPSSTSTDSADTALGASRASLSFVHERPTENQAIDEFTESDLLD
jgi:hypothetical protein